MSTPGPRSYRPVRRVLSYSTARSARWLRTLHLNLDQYPTIRYKPLTHSNLLYQQMQLPELNHVLQTIRGTGVLQRHDDTGSIHDFPLSFRIEVVPKPHIGV